MRLRLPALMAAAFLLPAAAPVPVPAVPPGNHAQGGSGDPAQGSGGAGSEAGVARVAGQLAAHQAAYRLVLDSSRKGDVIGATGTMTYAVMDTCDGWAVQQRLDMTLTNRDGQDIQMVSDYATLEAKDGLKLRFRMRQATDTATTQVTAGEAQLERAGGPGDIHYELPVAATKTLPAGTMFPMWHTAHIIAGGEQGKKFLNLPLFDGTTETGAQDSFVVVTGTDKPQPGKFPALAKLPSLRVHIAFFDHAGKGQTPDYEVGMRYWENGVADDLRMDFGEFVMRGKLETLKLPPPRHC